MVAQNGPKMAQNGPNGPKMPINGNLKVAVVKNRESSVERRWNKLGEVQTEVFGAICRSGFPKIWPWGAQNGTKNAISRFLWSKTVGTVWNEGGMSWGWSKPKFLDPFHLHSMLFQPFWTTGTFELPFLGIFGQFGLLWASLGHIGGHLAAPNWSKNFCLDLS